MNKVYKVFPGGKFKVLTFSYDDGKIEDRRLVKLFNKFNLKATFNLNWFYGNRKKHRCPPVKQTIRTSVF